MEQVELARKKLGQTAKQIPPLAEFCEKQGLPADLVLGGALLVVALPLAIFYGYSIVIVLMTCFYPIFQSIRTIENKEETNVNFWISFWIVFGCFKVFEMMFGFILVYIPFFWLIRLLFFVYLLSPKAKGAVSIYKAYIRPHIISGKPQEFKYGYWRTDKKAEPGFSHELISSDTADILDKTDLDTLEAWPYDGVDTLLKAFHRNAERIPNNPMLGTFVDGKYEWQTWAEVEDRAKHIAFGLMAFNLAPVVKAEGQDFRFIGIQSKNRAEWVITHLANAHQSITTVAFFDTLGPDAQKYIINQTEMTSIAVSKDYIKGLATSKISDADGKLSTLKNIIVFESNISDEDKKLCEEAQLTLYTLDALYDKGKKIGKISTLREPTKDTYASFSYTSGTTGDPKGVKLSHGMLIQCACATQKRAQQSVNEVKPLTENDRYISYLPAAHSFEQALIAMQMISGMQGGFYRGDTTKLVDDIGILSPTLFPSVPRLYNRIYSKIKSTIDTKPDMLKKALNFAVDSKLSTLKAGGGFNHILFDAVLFKKMRELLGGKVRIMVTGSAPIAGDVLDFLKICFSAPICEGYGMTETSAGSVLTFPDDPQTGIVGGPLQNVKIKLRDIPEMNYFSTGTKEDPTPKGEVMLWGPSIMSGYFKNPEKTAEALTKDGWILSGDVGAIMPNGAIKIIDRAKNIFKLSQGEYIAPEKLENVYVKSQWVDQIWIHGDSLQNFIVAFVVVSMPKVKQWCEQNGKSNDDAVLKDTALKQAVLDDLNDLAIESKFNTLEKPAQMMLMKEPFSIENDYLTPTMKMKRNIAKQKLKSEIEELYGMSMMRPSKKK